MPLPCPYGRIDPYLGTSRWCDRGVDTRSPWSFRRAAERGVGPHNEVCAYSITEGLALIFRGIDRLREAFPNRAFTIDGRLGDIGEVIAALEYDLTLDPVSRRITTRAAPTADGLKSRQGSRTH